MSPTSHNADTQTSSLSIEALQAKIHLLQTLQAELEVQNQQLRQSEDEQLSTQSRYFDLYDQAPVGYCTLNEKGLILEANHTAASLVGTVWGGLKQWPISRLILPEDQDRYTLLRKKLLETAKPQECELRMVRVDGSCFWAHVKAIAIETSAGEQACHLVLIDISAQKQAEEALMESESKYRTLFETAEDGLLIADTETRQFLHANPAMCRMLGYSEKELQEKSLGDIHPADALPHIFSQFEGMARSEVTLVPDVLCLRKDGSVFPVDINAGHVKIQGQNCNVGFFRDISERKQAEETLRLFKALVENASDAIGMATPDGKHYYQNEAFTRLFGAIGENPSQTLYADPIIGAEVFRTIQAGENWQGEVKMFKADRSLLDIHLRAYAIKANDGHIIGVVGLHTDFTAQRQTERGQAESEKNFKRLFETMREGVFYQRADGTLIDVNAAALRMFGISRDAALDRTSEHPEWKVVREDRTLISPYEHPSILALRTGKPVQDIVGVWNPQKETYTWLAVSAVPEFLEGETLPYQVAVTMHDITQDKSGASIAV
jgi:PAS domain S-box-containing protein